MMATVGPVDLPVPGMYVGRRHKLDVWRERSPVKQGQHNPC
jgi:hypothetical protein